MLQKAVLDRKSIQYSKFICVLELHVYGTTYVLTIQKCTAVCILLSLY